HARDEPHGSTRDPERHGRLVLRRLLHLPQARKQASHPATPRQHVRNLRRRTFGFGLLDAVPRRLNDRVQVRRTVRSCGFLRTRLRPSRVFLHHVHDILLALRDRTEVQERCPAVGRRRERRVHVARTTALPFRAGLLDRPGMPDGNRHAAERVTPGPFGIALGGVVLLVPFLGLVHAFWPFTVDDTFITLRYARNLAVGEGLVWNPGQVPPAEGYTSFAWTVLLAPVHAWATDAEAWAKALGFVATVITIGLAMALAREATASRSPYEQRLAMLVTAAVLAWDVATAVHAVSRMDTAPFTMVTTAAMLCAARTLRTPSSAQFRRMTLLALAVGLTRPEGNLVLLVLFIVVGCTLPRAHARG